MPVMYVSLKGLMHCTSCMTTIENALYAAQDEFMEDMPIIPVYHYSDFMYVKSYVEDWGRSVLGTVDFSRAHID